MWFEGWRKDVFKRWIKDKKKKKEKDEMNLVSEESRSLRELEYKRN